MNLTDKPLIVSNTVAKKIVGVGNTKYWELVKAGKIKTVDVLGRSMAVYASLEALANPPPNDPEPQTRSRPRRLRRERLISTQPTHRNSPTPRRGATDIGGPDAK
jgi:hypothetical protein